MVACTCALRLRWKDQVSTRDRGCSELPPPHCAPAWVTVWDSVSEKSITLLCFWVDTLLAFQITWVWLEVYDVTHHIHFWSSPKWRSEGLAVWEYSYRIQEKHEFLGSHAEFVGLSLWVTGLASIWEGKLTWSHLYRRWIESYIELRQERDLSSISLPLFLLIPQSIWTCLYMTTPRKLGRVDYWSFHNCQVYSEAVNFLGTRSFTGCELVCICSSKLQIHCSAGMCLLAKDWTAFKDHVGARCSGSHL